MCGNGSLGIPFSCPVISGVCLCDMPPPPKHQLGCARLAILMHSDSCQDTYTAWSARPCRLFYSHYSMHNIVSSRAARWIFFSVLFLFFGVLHFSVFLKEFMLVESTRRLPTSACGLAAVLNCIQQKCLLV